MKVCLGGTFEPFHAGHRALLQAAAEGADELFVGMTDAKLAHRKGRDVSGWQGRARAVEGFLREAGFAGRLAVQPITDAHGPAATGDYDRIVVSPETEPAALAINVARRKNGLAPLEVRIVPHVLGSDLLPLSGTAVHAGHVDSEGKRRTAVRVAVGSANPVKVDAVRAEMEAMLALEVEARPFAVQSGVPEQPRDDQTLRGARSRAVAARKAWPGCDYAVGVEAGLVRFPGGDGHMDAQACVVIDRTGWETVGWGPAFDYPAWATVRALAGEMVSDILGPLANDPRLGSTTGAVGWLTNGHLDRVGLTRSAVLMAFVPRFRRALYQLPPPAL